MIKKNFSTIAISLMLLAQIRHGVKFGFDWFTIITIAVSGAALLAEAIEHIKHVRKH